jgi:hypothetical protein
MKLAPALALIALIASVGLAACGDDDEETTTAADTTTTETTEVGATGEEGATGESDFQPKACPGAASPPNITEVTSYGADCAAVEEAMAEIGAVKTRFSLGDFSCERTSGHELAGTWTCRGEATYFTFKFAD